MGGLWRAKDTVYLALAVLFFLTFALGVIIGVSYSLGYPRYDPGFLPIITATCVPTSLVPGVIFLYLGRRARETEKSLVEFAAWVKTYRRISMADLARKLGKAPYEAERVLIQVVDRGLVPGFIDRSTDEFVLQSAVGQEQFIDRCPRCNGNLQRRYFQGETVRCPYCQSVIVGPLPKERQVPSSTGSTENAHPGSEGRNWSERKDGPP